MLTGSSSSIVHSFFEVPCPKDKALFFFGLIMFRRVALSIIFFLLFVPPAWAELIENLIKYKVEFLTFPQSDLRPEPTGEMNHPLSLLRMPTSSLVLSYDLDDVYRERIDGRNSNSLYQKRFDLVSLLVLKSDGRDLGRLGFFAADKTERGNLSFGQNKFRQTFSLHNEETWFSYANRIGKDFLFGLSLGTNQHGDCRNLAYAGETELGFKKSVRARMSADSKIDYYYDVNIDYQDENLSFYAPFRSDRRQIELSLNAFGGVWLGMKKGYSSGHSQHLSLEDIDEYSIKLNRSRHSTEEKLCLDLGRDFRFALSLAQIEDEWEGRLESSAVGFGKCRLQFQAKYYAMELSLPGFISSSPLFFGFSYSSCYADVFARLQTWPFTPIIIDLLGDRRYLEGSGNLKIYDLDAKSLRAFSERYVLKTEMSLIVLKMDGNFLTWQPVWMGMGRMNLDGSRMSLREAKLLHLSLDNHFKLNSYFSLGVLVNQYIPLSVKRGEIRSGQEEPPAGETSGDESRSVWGGTSFKVTLKHSI